MLKNLLLVIVLVFLSGCSNKPPNKSEYPYLVDKWNSYNDIYCKEFDGDNRIGYSCLDMAKYDQSITEYHLAVNDSWYRR